ncbi:LacI family DNA-binding transcriptional regulator [Priestia abyssalis]|uniref:LacI family DNA-binding transcriptional regulator n=1 Tax=Priestia abyssalis TaxID=1221450 RepID=UPI0009958199|nr:LacI family DNA-binding transcriptional regulator [Priestia abyssalis]
MKPTIYDVANAAGVSIATVSMVINNTGRISTRTRNKVLKVMDELKYYPSAAASTLTGKSTRTLGLLMPNIANPFYSELARNMEDRADELGYSVIVCSTDYKEEREQKYVSLFLRKQVDGFIITSGFNNVGLIKELIDQQIPIILVAYNISQFSLNTVSVDDYIGGYQATAHLAELGHQRIAVITETVQSSVDRIRGYHNALKDYELVYDEDLCIEIAATVANGEKATEQFLKLKEPPTAIFAFNDILALGAMEAVRKRGLSIPEDISIIGFDDTLLASYSNPPLTTIAQPLEDIGDQAIDLIVAEIEGKKRAAQRIMLLPELVVRKSTGPLKK